MLKRPSYRFSVDAYGDAAVLRLGPQRYLSDSQVEFGVALREAIGLSRSRCVVVDFSDAVLVTSGLIGAMVAAHRQVECDGGRVVAAGGGEFTLRVLKFAANIVDHYPDV